ncbi:DNA-dependent protein kinase catalytic subunit [Caerostris extrusa]|uniref:DNA-dependent protein kinase catalytic subunit n=1 Tax=Caerostris extrusa TaxID=172846 RepID=A0AAV4M9T7_CAEEX|nr:DNA-dependent protein kinase catalytic subunit [Caerostris extrusa]
MYLDPENSYLIFDISRKVILNVEKYSNKTSSVIKAGLQLLAAHARQFEQIVFENCVDLFHDIMKWVEHPNRDMQKLGRDTLVQILKVTAEMVSSKYTEDMEYCTKVFKYFMNQFREIFLSSKSSSKVVQIAVIAYGLFAKPCKLCLSENEVKIMLQNLIQKCEHIFLSSFCDRACIRKYYFSLEKLTVFQIDKFHKVPSAYSFIVSKVVIRILLSVQPKRELFLDFLTQIVYQGLVKTCSHPIVAEAEILKDKTSPSGQKNQNEIVYESSKKIITYKDYVYFWKSLLNVVQLKELNSLGIPLEQRQSLMESIYDELIKSSIMLISKLDLNLNQQSTMNQEDIQNKETEISSDPLYGVQPNNKLDYYIFINLVDFLRDLFSSNCTELFSKWVFTFGKEMIFHAAKHSYHSGFYKLISLTLSICSEIGYFKEFMHVQKSNIKPENISEDKWRSFRLFSKFVTEVAVRQQQFKDDLLASCLQVLLSLPIEIVSHEINCLVPALERALKFGVSYLPLANTAISALEKWSEYLPLDIIKPHFVQLLPHLNNYLLASTFQDDTSIPTANMKKHNMKKGHKMSSKSIKRSNTNALDSVLEDPALLKIQHRIIMFLGKLGEHNIALLENAYEKLDEVAIAWDSLFRNHLKYAVPFQDVKLDIYFDDFLPRILEIATKSSVRQAKVAACEAFYIRRKMQTEHLLNKLNSFSLHPNAFKRIGAALTFNNIYTIFREEEALVNKFTIQLLVQFVDSLAIAHTDEASLGTEKLCVAALNHIERIITQKQKLFLKTELSRKKPECLEEATLQCAVLWLLKQCGCIQTECRHKCMELVVKLAVLIPSYTSATAFLLTYNCQNKNIFEDVFENVLRNFSDFGSCNQMTLKSICCWLEALQTSMDCYQWAFSKQIFLQNELHGEKYSSMISSVKIYKAIEYYIENIVKSITHIFNG